MKIPDTHDHVQLTMVYVFSILSGFLLTFYLLLFFLENAMFDNRFLIVHAHTHTHTNITKLATTEHNN